MSAIYNSLVDARRAYARGRRYLANRYEGIYHPDADMPTHVKEKLDSLRHHTRPPSPKSARLEMARDRRRAKAEKLMRSMAKVLAAKKEEQS